MTTGQRDHYVIRGGVQGRERLRVLSRVLHPTTTALFDRLGIGEGLTCLDVGCGGGDVTFELAKRVGAQGKVVGADIDETKLALAREEHERYGVRNIEFRTLDIRDQKARTHFDVVYARFLLTHLSDPAGAVSALYDHLKPGGMVIVEDIDFSGYFIWPESKAFRRYHDLYCTAVKKRGGDPNIGPRVPLLLLDGGFEDVSLNVVQPSQLQGEAKLLNPLTMENIADTVLQDHLSTREEIDAIVQELYDFAADPRTVAGAPRIVQTWGRKPFDSSASSVSPRP